jgi:hypothetical protein
MVLYAADMQSTSWHSKAEFCNVAQQSRTLQCGTLPSQLQPEEITKPIFDPRKNRVEWLCADIVTPSPVALVWGYMHLDHNEPKLRAFSPRVALVPSNPFE